MLKEAAPPIEELTSMRNAVEHPEGYSGKLVVANFTLGADRRIDEPTWHREKDGKAAGEPSSIRADMETSIHNLLTLGEDVFVSWSSDSSGSGHDARCIHPGGQAQPALPNQMDRHGKPASRRFGRQGGEQKARVRMMPASLV